MIRIETVGEVISDNHMSWGTKIAIDGEKDVCISQLISIFNGIYEKAPELFEKALIDCQYTEDHT